jgi:hypothetical protein
VGQPVFGGLLDGHRTGLADARLDVGVQVPELVPYLGLGLAAYLATDSLAIRAVPERDDAAQLPVHRLCSSGSRQAVLWSE